MLPLVLAGRYVVGGELSGDPMTTVHRGYDNFLSRDVTITILRDDWAIDEAKVALFVSLYVARGSLVHPGIVGTFEVGSSEVTGRPAHWAVGESVAAPNLDRFAMPGSWAQGWPDRVLHLALQTARAMKYAHLSGAVHGDLGPATVLLETELRETDAASAEPRIRITGFGPPVTDVASASDSPTTAQIRQWFSEHLQYPPPEHGAGQLPTRRSDIFGFGCVLAALLLLGEHTGPRDRTGSATGSATGDDVTRDFAADTLGQLHAIANQAMSDNPEERQHSFSEVIEQLRSVGMHRGGEQRER
ncbi:serine/threonine protein kinase [Glaciihabitans tibetensis]|uniref:Serine/threonine protein kinase n=1 Tax=Glaciihabitans tibetensis TaxID=1266600 RepID=A0A2T0VCL7_9MICO|nr:serine/threonine protein kinase [Glaciihabitans tibetensis]